MKTTFDRSQPSTLFRRVFLGVALSILPLHATAQDAVHVSAEALGAVSASCSTADGCQAAIDALVAELAAGNPGLPIGVIIGGVASSLSAAYNEGIISGSVAQIALQSLAAIAESNGLAQLASSIRGAVANAAAGNPIDVEAVAEGSASPT